MTNVRYAADEATEFRMQLKSVPSLGIASAALLLVLAGGMIAWSYWPDRKPNLDQAFYTTDDGQTWFTDDMYLAPPILHDGKPAFAAQVFSYANGKKQFCAYMTQFKPEAKGRLETQVKAARDAGRLPGTAPLLSDRGFMNGNLLVKKPGQHEWVPYNDPKATKVMTPTSPDGSEVDQVLSY